MTRILTITAILFACASGSWAQGRPGFCGVGGERARERSGKGGQAALARRVGTNHLADLRFDRGRRGTRGCCFGCGLDSAAPRQGQGRGCDEQIRQRGRRSRGGAGTGAGKGLGRRVNETIPAVPGSPTGSLSAAEQQALRDALLDEYAADTYYTKVIEKLGASRKFENIRRAERRHAGALLTLCEKYGVEPPDRSEAEAPDSPDTMHEATQLAVELEIQNGKLYETMMSTIEHDDIKSVFERLRSASLNHHLPALKRGL